MSASEMLTLQKKQFTMDHTSLFHLQLFMSLRIESFIRTFIFCVRFLCTNSMCYTIVSLTAYMIFFMLSYDLLCIFYIL